VRALVSTVPGGPESLAVGTLPDPDPGPGEVLLRVHACGVNFPDALTIRDLYQVRYPRPFAPGAEVCGTVERLGEGAAGLAVGDRVVASCMTGGMAERLAVPARACTRLPPGTDPTRAAGFMLTYATAWHALVDRAAVRAGETVLVLGAAGGVGSAAVDIGRALGTRVIAAASSDERLAFARALGAAEGVVYPRTVEAADGAVRAVAATLKAAIGPGGADVIVDPVGGALSEAALRVLGREGRFLVVGFVAGIPRVPLNLVLLKSSRIVGVDVRMFRDEHPRPAAENAARLVSMLADGTLRPPPVEAVPLERGAEAIARLMERRATGKLVVTVSP
jgi:NADPH2:quinone reductase